MTGMIEFSERGELDRALAACIADHLRTAIADKGSASLAVSGGSTPKGMFAELAQQDLDWQRVGVTLVDERWVPEDHPDSNAALVRANLLQGPAAAARFFPLYSGAETPAEGLAATEASLTDLAQPFTVCVLGMGGDGHTASWFPQASNLDQLIRHDQSALLLDCEPITAPHPRITFTLPPVLASEHLILHITGEDKRKVLNEASACNYPIAAAVEQTVNPPAIYWAP